ncbi:hypothetical protein HY948_01970 [Candidatus Gottesmanbacteria bacterium]|nr:hypothetical protein [Candidatus Gottesmanbacteria bacterium]
MAKYVPDVKTQRWVIIASSRTKRPSDAKTRTDSFAPASKSEAIRCPFCPDNESLTPPEVYRIGSGEKDKPGWDVRVVPNKFPITDVHEVIIHSPSDTDDVEKLPLPQVTKVISCYRDRYRAHETDGQVLIFCNHGFHAGASLKHPHSQLVVVPRQINIDALSREPIANIVEDNASFITYCPDFSQWPLEAWIAPKALGTKFGDLTDPEISILAGVLQSILRKIESVSTQPEMPHMQDPTFVYNYYIYHGSNWYIRIIPRLVHRAGFELGTGLNVNVIDPAEAAELLRKG